MNQILEAVDKNKNEIAGLIIEPIQGEGGDNHFRCEFFQQLRQLADEHEFLLIFDEVQTGAGITGSMWAHQQFNPNKCNCDCNNANTQPDIISFGKKTQVCGIFAGKKLDEVENNVFHESSRLNSTWGGNIVDMVRITIYLEIIAKEIYHASEVVADTKIRDQLKDFEAKGYGNLPICVAKTQYSFSTDPSLKGAPSGHVVPIREVKLSSGAEFVVIILSLIHI